MDGAGLTILVTDIPQAGWGLAIKRSRTGVKTAQPAGEVRDRLRAACGRDTAQLPVAPQAIATPSQTAANSRRRGLGAAP